MEVSEVPCDKQNLQREDISEEKGVTNCVMFKPLDRLVWLWWFLSSSSWRESHKGSLWRDYGGPSILL